MEDKPNRKSQYLITGPLAAKKAELVRQLGKIGSWGKELIAPMDDYL